MRYKNITVDKELASSPLAKGVEGVKPIADRPLGKDFREGKHELHLGRKKGEAFDLCASLHDQYICCSTHVLRSVSNCPFECSYCFLQNYLNNSTTTLVIDTDALMAEVREKTELQPWRFFRVGTWELGDSLALEPLIPAASELVGAFATLPNAVLKLRTKTDHVDQLLDLDHRGRTVVSWTLNPEKVIRREEFLTASLTQRLEAMRKVADAGYLVGLHFDPMIVYDGWEVGYASLVRQIFAAVPADRIPWISMGSLRFNPEMKRTLENNYPASRITAAEMVLGTDNKYRYVRPLRLTMYRHLLNEINEAGGGDCFTYLCMERWNVWERVFGKYPRSTGHLDYLLTRSLHERFPGLVHVEPDVAKYEKY